MSEPLQHEDLRFEELPPAGAVPIENRPENPPQNIQGEQAADRIVPYPRTEDHTPSLRADEHGTDLDASLRFVESHAAQLRYCPEIGWLYWDQRRWAVDSEGRAMELSKQSAREWTLKWTGHPGEDRNIRVKLALAFESAPHIKATVGLAKSDPRLVASVADLDRDPWLLNVKNGTIDLRTGKLQPHNREDFITKLAPVTFDPKATHPQLIRYLAAIERATPGMSAFLARSFGATLSGDASPETLFLLQGDGGSGKTTCLEAVSTILGDYAVKLRFESVCSSKHGRSPGGVSPDLIKLRGSRLAFASEGEQSARLDAGMVKELTGGETITARALYSSQTTFAQTWKFWLVSNFDPKADSEDSGIWRRMMKVHFTAIPEAERDPKVKQTLTEDCTAQTALLAWLVTGCLDWQTRGGGRVGLAPPEGVTAATNDYRSKQDTLGQWWSDLLAGKGEMVVDDKTQGVDVRHHYEDWCAENGAMAVFVKRFNSYLEAKGLENKRGTGGTRFWHGLRMKS